MKAHVCVLPLIAAGLARAQEGSGYYQLVQSVAELNVPANANHLAPSLTRDELTMIFASDRPGGAGGLDLYQATRANVLAAWSAPVNLAVVNSAGDDTDPCISFDGLELLFVSTRAGGFGSSDLWLATRTSVGQPWGAPQNLGPLLNAVGVINKDPHVTEDGLTLFFTSNGVGGADVYTVTRTSPTQPWQNKQPFAPANSPFYDHSAIPDANGRIVWFASDRPANFGSSDFYMTFLDPASNQWTTPEPTNEINSDQWESEGWRGGVTQSLYFSRSGHGSLAAIYRACSRYPVLWNSAGAVTDIAPRVAVLPTPRIIWERIWNAPLGRGVPVSWSICEPPAAPTLAILLGSVRLLPFGIQLRGFSGEFFLDPILIVPFGFEFPIRPDQLTQITVGIPNDAVLLGNILRLQAMHLEIATFRGEFSEPAGLRYVP